MIDDLAFAGASGEASVLQRSESNSRHALRRILLGRPDNGKQPMIANQDLINSFQLIESRRARISPAEGDPDRARQQIISVLIASRNAADVQEFQCPMKNTWELSIFHALLKRYGIKAYRYRKQRQSTIMIRVSKRFLDETLWPIFNEVILDLQRCFDEIVRNLLPAIAASPYDISVIDHEHRAGEMCENCRKRLMEEVT